MSEFRVGRFRRELASHTGAAVLVEIHSEECRGCREFLRSLEPLKEEFEAWDGRLVVRTTGDARAVAVDRYGQIFYSVDAGEGHRFPSPRELTEWLKHLGTLCPE